MTTPSPSFNKTTVTERPNSPNEKSSYKENKERRKSTLSTTSAYALQHRLNYKNALPPISQASNGRNNSFSYDPENSIFRRKSLDAQKKISKMRAAVPNAPSHMPFRRASLVPIKESRYKRASITSRRSIASNPPIFEEMSLIELPEGASPLPSKTNLIPRKAQVSSLLAEKFKKIARKITHNAMWCREAATRAKQVDPTRSEEKDGINFNVNAFRRSKKQVGRLSQEAIAILNKPSETRSPKEIDIVRKFVYNLSCFNRYALYVKQELAKVIYYDKFEDGRIIIKQGHVGTSFYFIVSGSVVVERTEYDSFKQRYYTQIVGELHAGDSFGELSLLHNTKRAATIICRGMTELMRVDKPDFDEVLRNSHEHEWEMRVNLLNTHYVFKGWSSRDLALANGHSKLKIFNPRQVVVSEKKIQSNRIFFILSGHCVVIRKLDLVKRSFGNGKYRYLLPSLSHLSKQHCSDKTETQSVEYHNVKPPQFDSSRNTHSSDISFNRQRYSSDFEDQIEMRYFTVKELTDGDFFNVGECLDGLYVMSTGRTTIAQVGKVAFSRHGGSRVLEEMKTTYTSKLPSTTDVFKTFISMRKWNCFKRGLVKTIMARKSFVHSVDLKDIPGVVRKEQVYYLTNENIV